MQAFRTKGLFGGDNPAFAGPDDPAQKEARKRYLGGLNSPAPINWLSDHLKEDQQDFGAVFIALKVLMSQVASAKVKAYKWHPDAKVEGDQERKKYLPRTHPICRLLNRPNPRESGRTMRARAVQQRSLTGTWLGWRVDEGTLGTDADDRPSQIWTVPTGTYTAVPMSSQYPDGAYRIMPFYPGPYAMVPGSWQAAGVIVPADQMLVSQHPHPLTYKEGLSPMAACAPELDTINKIGRARNSIMTRAPVPSGFVEIDTNASFPDQPELNRIVAQIYNFLGGPDRAGRPAVLGPGQKWVPNEMQGLELPWADTWDQLMSFVFAVLGTTRTMVGMDEASSYAALFAVLKQNRLVVLQPELDDLADCINQQLILPWFGEEYGCEFEPEAVGDEELLEKQLTTDLAGGYRRFNEYRALRKLPLVDGPEGEAFVKGGAAAGQGKPGEEGTNPDGSPKQPGEEDKAKNDAGEGSLPTRISSHVHLSQLNGNGKKHFSGFSRS